jgi:hypothetical protein
MGKGAAGAAVVFGAIEAAQAAIVQYEFEATATVFVPNGRPAGYETVQTGDKFNVSFGIDTSVPDSEGRYWWGVYQNAVKNVKLSVPSRGIDAAYGNGTLQISDGETRFQNDEVRVDIPIDNIGSTFIFWLRANSLDGVNAPSVLTSDAMPALIDVSQYNFTRSTGLYHNAGGAGNYSIFTGAPVAIPEPALCGLALVALPLLARRRKA